MANTYSLDLERDSSQYASIVDASQTGLDIAGDISIEAWIKLESMVSTHTIAAKWDGNWAGKKSYWFSYVPASDKIAFEFSGNGSAADYHLSSALGLSTGVWYHVAMVFTAASHSTTFYLNGTAVGTDSGGTITALYNSSAPFLIGDVFSDGSAATTYFDGLIDEVRIWNDVRTITEIANNYQTELVGNEANLQGYWKLNNDYLDATANNNDLTASGSPVFSVDVPFTEEYTITCGAGSFALSGISATLTLTTTNTNLITKGTELFATNDILRIKEGTDDEWMRVNTVISQSQYSVSRDLAGAYDPNANPAWTKGATVVNYGQSGQGMIEMAAAGTNTPWMKVLTHAGSPWSATTERLRIGNLNGFLGYATDLYGIAIGETTKYLKYDTTNGLRIAGDITSSTINIPNATTPLFSVDASGNVVANSLKRNDFHWFTVFESIDGYSKITDGAGTIVTDANGLLITTGAVSNNDCEIKRSIGDQQSWNKNSKLKCEIQITSNSYQEIYIVMGRADSSSNITKHYGFFIWGNEIYATIANGTDCYQTSLTTFSANASKLLEAVLDVSTGLIKFYIDETLVLTSDGDGTPTGSGNYAFFINVRDTNNEARILNVKWWDFWQAI